MLTETLQEHHIPFQMKEHMVNIYQHFIAKDMIAYMKLGMGERHRSLFLTICNRPVRYLSRTCMDQEKVDFEDLRKCYAEKEWMQDIIDQFDIDIRMLNRMAPFAAVQYIRKRIGYDEFLKQYAKEHQIPLEQLMEVMCEFENRCREYRTYEEFLQHVVLYTEELENQNKENQKIKERNKEKIQLMTMHASKGLEFQSVYIIHANEGEIPYQKAQTEEEIEEERRTFYVAMTRAKDRLEISYLLEKHERSMKSSRFVNEILGQASS